MTVTKSIWICYQYLKDTEFSAKRNNETKDCHQHLTAFSITSSGQITKQWYGKDVCDRCLPSPLGNGWQMYDNVIMPVLMTKEAAPVAIMELAVCKCEKSSCRSNHHCICRKNERPCTEGCGCMSNKRCQNPQTLQVLSDNSSDKEAWSFTAL